MCRLSKLSQLVWKRTVGRKPGSLVVTAVCGGGGVGHVCNGHRNRAEAMFSSCVHVDRHQQLKQKKKKEKTQGKIMIEFWKYIKEVWLQGFGRGQWRGRMGSGGYSCREGSHLHDTNDEQEGNKKQKTTGKTCPQLQSTAAKYWRDNK